MHQRLRLAQRLHFVARGRSLIIVSRKPVHIADCGARGHSRCGRALDVGAVGVADRAPGALVRSAPRVRPLMLPVAGASQAPQQNFVVGHTLRRENGRTVEQDDLRIATPQRTNLHQTFVDPRARPVPVSPATMMGTRRLFVEYKKLQKSPVDNICAKPREGAGMRAKRGTRVARALRRRVAGRRRRVRVALRNHGPQRLAVRGRMLLGQAGVSLAVPDEGESSRSVPLTHIRSHDCADSRRPCT